MRVIFVCGIGIHHAYNNVTWLHVVCEAENFSKQCFERLKRLAPLRNRMSLQTRQPSPIKGLAANINRRGYECAPKGM